MITIYYLIFVIKMFMSSIFNLMLYNFLSFKLNMDIIFCQLFFYNYLII